MALVVLQGLPARFSPETVRLASYMGYRTTMPHDHDPCWHPLEAAFSSHDAEACLVVKPGMRNVLLFGDSHANHLRPGLAAAYPDLNIREAASSGCTPLLTPKAMALQPCRDMLAFMFGEYLPQHPGGWVIVSANWAGKDVAGAAQTVDWLNARGFHVILSGPVVRYRLPLSELLALATWRHDPGLIDRFRAPGAEQLDAQFAAVAAQHGARYLSPYRAICAIGAACRTVADNGVPVQWDEAHLTNDGALMVARQAPLADIPVTP